MRFLEFQAFNYGKHADKTIRLSPGLNVLVGANGGGKSTLVDGMLASLTGDFVGVKEDSIRIGTGKKDRSFIRSRLEHAGTQAEVIRSLAPNSRSLVIGGDKKGRTEGEVNAALWGFLGVSKAVIADYAFVRQWETFTVLSATPGKRLEVLNRLFRVDQVAKLHQQVSDRLSSLGTFTSDASPLRLAEAEGRLAQAKTRLADVDDRLSRLMTLEACQRTVRDYQAAAAYRQEELRRQIEFRQATQALTEAEQSLASYQEEHDRVSAEAAAALEAARAIELDAVTAESMLKEWMKWDSDTRYHQRVAAEQAERVSKRDLLGPTPNAIDAETHANDIEQLCQIDARLRFLKTYLTAHAHVDSGVCPTCGQKATADLRTDYLRKQAEVQNLEANRPVVSSRVEHGRRDRKVLADWNEQWNRLSSGITALPPAPTPPAASREAAALVIQEKNRLVREMDRAGANSASSLRAIRMARAAKQKAADTLARLSQKPTTGTAVADPPSENEYQAALRDQASRGATEQERQAVLREIEVSTRSRDELVRLLEEGRANAARSMHLDKLKQVFLPSALTARVVDRCLASLSTGMNAKLGEFGGPFSVKVAENASFDVTFPGGQVVSAGRLSGGEKMILALAFRLSVLEAFGGELGFLCLDEPTVGLDIDNRLSLTRCLAAAGRAAREAGGQLLIVTHDRQLAQAADNVIDLAS